MHGGLANPASQLKMLRSVWGRQTDLMKDEKIMALQIKRLATCAVFFASLVPSVALAQSAARNQCEFYGEKRFIGIANGEAVALEGQKEVYNTMAFKTYQGKPAKITSVKVKNGCMAGVTSGIGTGASEYNKDIAVNKSTTTGLYCICK